MQSDVQPTSWLFTRADSSVRMLVSDQLPRAVLIVYGPGAESVTYDFPDLRALFEFASQHQQKLQQEGFQLQAIAERRSGGAGRPHANDPERRRR